MRIGIVKLHILSFLIHIVYIFHLLRYAQKCFGDGGILYSLVLPVYCFAFHFCHDVWESLTFHFCVWKFFSKSIVSPKNGTRLNNNPNQVHFFIGFFKKCRKPPCLTNSVGSTPKMLAVEGKKSILKSDLLCQSIIFLIIWFSTIRSYVWQICVQLLLFLNVQ